MHTVELSNWYLQDNELTIPLMRFYVKIAVVTNENDIFYQLKVIDDDDINLTFNLNSLEEAILFTERVISKCCDSQEIIRNYLVLYGKEDNNTIIRNLEGNNNIIYLTPDEVDQAILNYYGTDKVLTEELSIKDNNPQLVFKIIERVDVDGAKKEHVAKVSFEDLKESLSQYIDFYNYDLVDFKYMGGVRRVGYFRDSDTPYYEGIKLIVKPKEKTLIKKNID